MCEGRRETGRPEDDDIGILPAHAPTRPAQRFGAGAGGGHVRQCYTCHPVLKNFNIIRPEPARRGLSSPCTQLTFYTKSLLDVWSWLIGSASILTCA